jgi:hypothetical protein
LDNQAAEVTGGTVDHLGCHTTKEEKPSLGVKDRFQNLVLLYLVEI